MPVLRPLRLFLLRHPETEDNRAGRFAGERDSPLSAAGVAQMQATVQRFKQVRFSAVHTSLSGRAKCMAQALAVSAHAPVQARPELQERRFGQWEGLTFAEAQNKTPHAMQAWMEDPIEACPPGGESLAQCAQRLRPFIAQMEREALQPGDPLAIVSHGATLRIVVALVLKLPLDAALKLECSHAGVSIMDLFGPDAAVLRLWNDTSHLH